MVQNEPRHPKIRARFRRHLIHFCNATLCSLVWRAWNELRKKRTEPASHGSLRRLLAAVPPPSQPTKPQRETSGVVSEPERRRRRGRQEQHPRRRPPPARRRGRRAVRRHPLPRAPRGCRSLSRRVPARGGAQRARLLRPCRRHRRRRRARAAHQGALHREAGGRHGVRQQLQAREAAHLPRRRRRGDQRMGPGYSGRRRDPADARRWQEVAEAAAGAGLRRERSRVQRLGADLLRHPAKLHSPLRRRVRRQSSGLISLQIWFLVLIN